jgi:hypothetical protein
MGFLQLTEDNKRGKRRSLTKNAIERQKRIAKQSVWHNKKLIEQPHRMAKHHAMDCGRTKCMVCGNPRRTMKQKTLQEKKFLEEYPCEWIGDDDVYGLTEN